MSKRHTRQTSTKTQPFSGLAKMPLLPTPPSDILRDSESVTEDADGPFCFTNERIAQLRQIRQKRLEEVQTLRSTKEKTGQNTAVKSANQPKMGAYEKLPPSPSH